MEQNYTEDKNRWDSCCGRSSDKRLLIFSANLTISIILMVFSLVRLSDDKIIPDERAIYVGFITLITGIWLKSPLS